MSEQEDGRQANAADAPAEGGASASGEFGLPPVDEIFFPPVDAFPSAVESAPGPVAPPAPPSAPVVAAAPAPMATPPPAPVAAAPAPAPVAVPGPSESLGRSSASYASAQPHTLQPSRVEVADQPAVIVEPEAMQPPRSAPKLPQQTMPMTPIGHHTPQGAVPAAALAPGWTGPQSAQQTARVRPPTLVIRPQTATVRGAGAGPNATLVKVATFLGVLFVVVLLGSAVLFLLDRRAGSDPSPPAPAPKATTKAR